MHGSLPWDNRFRALLSTPYVTGVVLHDRRCWFEQFEPECIRDGALDGFIRERIRVGADETVEGTGAVVSVHTRDGRTLVDRRAFPRGDAADPLTRDEIVTKFRDSAEGMLEPDATERAIEMLVGLADLPRVRDLCSILSRGVPAAPGS
jgi:2-methylcitrate dehydratase PrpD